MNILVTDVAASESGALTVLKLYYEKLKEDTENHYYFCISKAELAETKSVTVLPFPWVKKSWFHRLWFDHFVCGRLVKKYGISRIFSLQNITVPHVNIPQTVYLHQSLPFVTYRYRFLENPKLWVYQNIISKLIFSSLKRAENVIVQTKWMKQSVIEKTGIPQERISVETPPVYTDPAYQYCLDSWNQSLFYPATGFDYKNHKIIFKALSILKEQGKFVPKVILTLSKEEILPADRADYERVKDFICFTGKISRDRVFEYMSKSVLVFPSYIETVSLPLIEAKSINTPILASSCPFSLEVLEGYKPVWFFDPFSPQELADAIEKAKEFNNGNNKTD